MHKVFDNNKIGFKELVRWTKEFYKGRDKSRLMFCGENTGTHSVGLSEYLTQKGYFIWIEAPIIIKRSLGLTRGKSDKADSARIAEYAMRHEDKAKAYTLKTKEEKDLMLLYKFRHMTATELARKKNMLKDMEGRQYDSHYYDEIIETYREDIKTLTERKKYYTGLIREAIMQSSAMASNYHLITSICGIGDVNATALILYTDNFTRFPSAKALGAYCGVVPYEYTSGTSIRGRSHVSFHANRELKSLLTLAANNAVVHDPLFAGYFRRMSERNKPRAVVINNVRYKLLKIMVSMVKHGTPYDPYHPNPYNRVHGFKASLPS